MHYDKDYSRLIIDGEAPESVLKEAWNTIYAQYCELMQDGSYNELLDKTAKMQVLNGRIAFLDGAIIHLQWTYDPVIIQIINEMAIPLVLAADEDPIKKLKAVQGRVKRMILDLEKLQRDVTALQDEKKEEAGLEYYEDWLSIMSKTYGYAVRAKDITVLQFVRNQKKLNQQAQKQKKDGN